MILVDPRDGSKELIPLLGDMCVPCHLESGDVIFHGNGPDGDLTIGIEVKKVGDLLNSETTGRLAATQLPAMLKASYWPCWILVVGSYRMGMRGELQVRHRGGWVPFKIGNRTAPYSYVEAFLIEVEVFGFKVKVVDSNESAAKWIEMAYRWWQKDWADHKAMLKFDKSHAQRRALMPHESDPDFARKLKVASFIKELPALGWDRAMRAAEHFPTVIDAVNATEQDWSSVPGIGKVIAKEAVRYVRER